MERNINVIPILTLEEVRYLNEHRMSKEDLNNCHKSSDKFLKNKEPLNRQ